MFGRAALTSAMISLWLFVQLLEGAHRLEMENQNFSEFIDWSCLYMEIYIFPPSRRINSLREINEAARANKNSRISYAILFIRMIFGCLRGSAERINPGRRINIF